MNECDHIVGIVYDYADTRLNFKSVENDYKKHNYQDYEKFKFCPECGMSLICKNAHVFVVKIQGGQEITQCYKCGEKLEE